MDPDSDPLREHALRLLGRRGYSRGELARRLESKGHDRDLTNVVIERLVACGLLDDEAYAHSVAAMVLQKKPASAALIEQKLLSRRIPPEIARRVATEILTDTDPLQEATRMARGILKQGALRSAEATRRRIGAALARRGFDTDIIWSVLDGAGLGQPSLDESFDREHGT